MVLWGVSPSVRPNRATVPAGSFGVHSWLSSQDVALAKRVIKFPVFNWSRDRALGVALRRAIERFC